MDQYSSARRAATVSRTLAQQAARALIALFLLICLAPGMTRASVTQAQSVQGTSSALTPLQREIEKQRQRLASSDPEERRDAVMHLGQMKRPDSSQVAAPALHDLAGIVRATATRAVLSLPTDEAAALLIPLLQDADEFVRREAAYALGETRSRRAVEPLINSLAQDKLESVRSSAAVALGQIGDEVAVIPLTQTFTRRFKVSSGFLRRKKQIPENEFVRRAAALSLGQIKSRAAVPALVAVLSDERAEPDVRREAARALGLIGDPAAIIPLRAALTARDPYLSRIAYEALRKISPAEATSPT
ncbi:MAG TPA: HEAT repeat domain-containing protein [Pyrinomonadaceae bacterium]|jgi:HEAT repeat protein|nr:HEAT repeat domain-containing protein [Pyrinomonadaceae bacterium]